MENIENITKEEMIDLLNSKEEELKKENREDNSLRIRLIEALKRDANYQIRDSNYLDFSLDQRLQGSGSWYEGLSKKKLLKKLISLPIKDISESIPGDARNDNCTYLGVDLPGKNGIRFIDELPEDSSLYLSILHKGTGRFSLSTTKQVPAADEEFTTIIMENEEGIGEMVSTFHPGLPVARSNLTIESLIEKYPNFAKELNGKDGQEVVLQISKDQAHSIGMDMAKLVSKEPENVIDVRNNIRSLSEVRDRNQNINRD